MGRRRPGVARGVPVIVYGQNPVREALRGPRAVRRIWAVKGDWSGAPVARASAEAIAARCGSDAHQGVCADVEEYRYADGAELLARPSPFLVALDEVTDPQNLGAVCRTAECAGATGVVLPERRSAEVTPAVCKASAGATSPTSSPPPGAPSAGATARPRVPGPRTGRPTTAAASSSCSARRAEASGRG